MSMKLAVLVFALLIGLSGCAAGSSSDPSSDDRRVVRELSQSFKAQEGRIEGLPPLDETQADCVARSLVLTVGTDALVKYGILRADLSASTSSERLVIPREPANQMVDAITACVDLAKMQQDELAGVHEPLAVKKCLENGLDGAGVRLILLSRLTGDKKTLREINRALSDCLARSGA